MKFEMKSLKYKQKQYQDHSEKGLEFSFVYVLNIPHFFKKMNRPPIHFHFYQVTKLTALVCQLFLFCVDCIYYSSLYQSVF